MISGDAEKEYWSRLRGSQGKHRQFMNKQGRYVVGINDFLNFTLPLFFFYGLFFPLFCWLLLKGWNTN